MSDKRIIDLTAGTALTGSEPFETVQGGASVQVPVSAISTYTGANLTSLNITTALGFTPTSGAGLVPYTGASANVNLGSRTLTALSATLTGLVAGGLIYADSGRTLVQDPTKLFYDTSNVLLYVGGSSGAFANTKLQIYDNVNSFSQANYQNINNGSSASSDHVWTADTGTNTSNYVNVGINNSGFSDATFTIAGALDGYLYNMGGNIAIGTGTAKDIVFFTNGTLAANERARIYSGGTMNVGIGTQNTSGNGIFRVTNGVPVDIGAAFTGTVGALWLNTAINTDNNFTLAGDATNTFLGTPGASGVITLTHANSFSSLIIRGTSTSGVAGFESHRAARTNLPANTNFPNVDFVGATSQWQTGTSANQFEYYLRASTFTGVGASTITNAYALRVDVPIAGTNMTITNNWAFGTAGQIQVGGVNKVAITQPTTSATLTLITGSSLITAGAFALTLTTTSTTNATFPTGTGTLMYLSGTNTWSAPNSFSPNARSSGSVAAFTVNGPVDTNQTLSTAAPKILLTLGSTQWATGALAATQPFLSITQPTISFVGASTATLVTSVRIAGAPIQGTNATNTTSVGLLIDNAASIVGAGTSYGLLANAQTGGTVNYAAGFAGNIILTTAGNKILITEGTNGSVGVTTLVAGTKAISIAGVTTSTRAFITLVTPSGTSLTTSYQAVCTSGTLTLQANIAAGTINSADTSVLNYHIIN